MPYSVEGGSKKIGGKGKNDEREDEKEFVFKKDEREEEKNLFFI